ncbi:MAG: FAD-binding and (Fe-S)-binding domain-containing protein [Phycisphaerales bacterium JB039]
MPRLPVFPAAALPESPGDLERALRAAGCGEVRFGRHDRMLYATDASNYQVEPVGVVIPRSVAEAVRAVGVCAAGSAAILARGGGTSLAGQCTSEAVVLDVSSAVNRVLAVDVEGRSCRVEPGVTIDDLNDELRHSGLMFAPDPATARHANIGGCIGNNAAGARSIRYGRTSENVLGIEALLVDGRRAWFRRGAGASNAAVRSLTQGVIDIVGAHRGLIRERFPKTIRRNAGYSLDLILDQIEEAESNGGDPLETVNLASLLCGSEGTLAVTLGAELRLRETPRHKGLATLGFDSLEAAIEAVAPILQTRPVAVELLDDMVLRVARGNIEYRRYADLMPPVAGKPARAVLYVEYFSELPGDEGAEEIEASFRRLSAAAPQAAMRGRRTPEAMAGPWKLRKAGEPLLHGIAGDRRPLSFVEDNAVPVENLAEFVRRFKQIVASHGTTAAYWAHASVGVLHVRPLLDLRDPEDERRMQAIAVEVADLARELGGVMSGEHGDGRVRSPLLERFYGPGLMGVFRQVKELFDPQYLLNPGNIVPRPGGGSEIGSITQRTRVRPGEVIVDVVGSAQGETFFDYSDQHGLRGAVEMCNGAGVCRKKSGGVMCPSFKATLDERHSTRGRGNALRLAITGQLTGGKAPWNDPETLETLDLCLSCKACKAECPSNVDIARLKAEYLAQGYRAQGAPVSARIVGHVRTLSRLGAIAPGFSNAIATSAPGRWALGRLIDLDPRRSLPPLRTSLRRRWGGRAAGALDPGADAPSVALFADCFTMYNEPHIGLAARRLLEAFGYRVRLVDAGCCGRAMISMGLLEQARGTIGATAERLEGSLGVGEPLLVLEPSCLSAIADDWRRLKLDVSADVRARIADRAQLVEQFLERRWGAHPRRPEMAGPSRGVLLHAHCHQKALWGAESSGDLLGRIVGQRLRVPDTTCCGMAGAFGYSRRRFDLSMKIGELSVFPAVREAPEAAICAPGTSCRHQIRDGTGREAAHPVEVLADLLAKPGR